MKINVCYKVVAAVDMEVSDEFKELIKIYDRDFSNHEDMQKWDSLIIKLDNDILNKLPANAEILGVYNTETKEIIYEN